MHWEILLLEPLNDWFLALCKDDPYKVGRWNAWYAEAIPLAEERYAAYRREADKEEQ